MRSAALLAALLAAPALLATTTAAAEGPTTWIAARVPWANDPGYTPVLVLGHASGAETVTLDVSCSVVSARTEVTPGPDGDYSATVLLPPATGQLGACYAARVAWRTDDGRAGTTSAKVDVTFQGADLGVVDPTRAVRPHTEWAMGADVVDIAVVDLPERWQAYPQWMGLLLTPEADRALKPGQRRALTAWSRAGGRLLVLDAAQDEAWRQGGALPTLIPRSLHEEAGVVDGRYDGVRVDGISPSWDALRPVVENLRDRRYWGPVAWPVPGTEDVPVGGFLVLVIGFAVVAGPLNLWWVARRRRRADFLWTTPALSAAACVALVAFNLLSEGVTTRRVRNELTLLDATHHEAFAWQAMSFFAQFGESTWHLDHDLLLVPLDPPRYRDPWDRHAESDELHLAWGKDGQHTAGEWVPARRTRQLVVSGPRSERQRLTVRAEGDGWRLTNGLDRALTWVTWYDADGTPWVAREVSPASDATLTRSTRDQVLPDATHPPDLFGQAARDRYQASGAAHHFRAQLDGPLTPTPGPDADDAAPARAWVFGPLAPAPSSEQVPP